MLFSAFLGCTGCSTGLAGCDLQSNIAYGAVHGQCMSHARASSLWLCPDPVSATCVACDIFRCVSQKLPDVMEIEVSPAGEWRVAGSQGRWFSILDDSSEPLEDVKVKADPDPQKQEAGVCLPRHLSVAREPYLNLKVTVRSRALPASFIAFHVMLAACDAVCMPILLGTRIMPASKPTCSISITFRLCV